MFSSRGTVRYVERGQGYRDVEEVGKHCSMRSLPDPRVPYTPSIVNSYTPSIVNYQLAHKEITKCSC